MAGHCAGSLHRRNACLLQGGRHLGAPHRIRWRSAWQLLLLRRGGLRQLLLHGL